MAGAQSAQELLGNEEVADGEMCGAALRQQHCFGHSQVLLLKRVFSKVIIGMTV